jgi:hypothetical protein
MVGLADKLRQDLATVGGARDSRRTLLGESAAHSPNESNREGRGAA